jgi:hypothetical protein
MEPHAFHSLQRQRTAQGSQRNCEEGSKSPVPSTCSQLSFGHTILLLALLPPTLALVW